GIAAHTMNDAVGYLPYNGNTTAVAGNNNTGSWGFQILPYIEQDNLFKTAAANGGVKTLTCFGRGRPNFNTGLPGVIMTDFALNCRLNGGGTGDPNRRRTIQAIPDGSSNTILIGHKYVPLASYGWSNTNWDEGILTGGTGGTGRTNLTSSAYIQD